MTDNETELDMALSFIDKVAAERDAALNDLATTRQWVLVLEKERDDARVRVRELEALLKTTKKEQSSV